MARLTDPETLARYKQALAEWRVEGAIVLQGRAPDGSRLALESFTEKHFKEAICRFVCEEGGEIDQVKEERGPWREHWEWPYDLRPTINGVRLYVETRLFPESLSSREEPTVLVIQIKPA